MAMVKSPVLQGLWSLAEYWQCETSSGEKNYRGGISSEESKTGQEAEKPAPVLMFIVWKRAEDVYTMKKIHSSSSFSWKRWHNHKAQSLQINRSMSL